jgi:hypothetical protein
MDFNAFYCGARVLSAGRDPYSYEPLRSCEHEHRQWTNSREVVPAPLPPYALAFLIPLARLPYAQSGFVWFALLLASMLVMIRVILQLTSLPLLAVGASITIAILIQALPTGSLAPVTLALLCAAAVTLVNKQWTATALLLGFAAVEPHVALPALLSTFVLVREMRVRLVVVAVALLSLSLALGGIALNLEYFARALPAHALSELGSVIQFSLSSMLHNFGMTDRVALAIGSLQYALFIPAGIWLAHSLRRDIPAVVVLVPMALAVTGGTYIHLSQVVAVLPLAFVIATYTRSWIAWAGIVLLTVPWNLLNALTPTTLVVPPFSEMVAGAFDHQVPPGGFAYVANALVYLGIACAFWGVFTARRQCYNRWQ